MTRCFCSNNYFYSGNQAHCKAYLIKIIDIIIKNPILLNSGLYILKLFIDNL